jgi:hypothetical protein
MTKSEMVSRIQKQLGSDGVEIEVPAETIESFVDDALDEIEPYIDETDFISETAGEVVDLSDRDIVDVVRVFSNTHSTGGSQSTIDLFRTRDYSKMMDRSTLPYRISQIEDYIDRAFRYDSNSGKLYLDDYDGEITIEVMKEHAVDNLKDKTNVNWVKKYALALTKESLGRIRGKFQVNSTPYENDGRDIVQEGKEEKRELLDKLEQEGKGFFFMTR